MTIWPTPLPYDDTLTVWANSLPKHHMIFERSLILLRHFTWDTNITNNQKQKKDVIEAYDWLKRLNVKDVRSSQGEVGIYFIADILGRGVFLLICTFMDPNRSYVSIMSLLCFCFRHVYRSSISISYIQSDPKNATYKNVNIMINQMLLYFRYI